MKEEDLSLMGDTLYVRVPTTKTGRPRSFTIKGVLFDIIKEYIAARPEDCEIDRFFLNYQNGKCTKQPINKFGMPRVIANVLKLPNATEFTGHSFRRTSATLLADSGADMTILKRHGDWESNTVVERYIAELFQNKRKIYNQITEEIVVNKKAKLDYAAEKSLSNLGHYPKIIDIDSVEGTFGNRSNKIRENRVLQNYNSNILKSDKVVIKEKEIPANLIKSSVFNFSKFPDKCIRTTKPVINMSTHATVQHNKTKICQLSCASAKPPSRVHQSLLSDIVFEDEGMNLFGADNNCNQLETELKDFEGSRARITSSFSDSVANVECNSNLSGSKKSSSSSLTRAQSESPSGQSLSTIFNRLEHLTDDQSFGLPVLHHPNREFFY